MFPETKPLAEPMKSANSFLTVLFRSVVPQRPKFSPSLTLAMPAVVALAASLLVHHRIATTL